MTKADWAFVSIAFDQGHFPPIDRNRHARGVAVDFYCDAPHISSGLAKALTMLNCRSSSGVILINSGSAMFCARQRCRNAWQTRLWTV